MVVLCPPSLPFSRRGISRMGRHSLRRVLEVECSPVLRCLPESYYGDLLD